jgi:signal transduction histidine kinase
LLDLAISAAALATTLAMLNHHAGWPPRPGELNWVSGLLAAAATLPLAAWRWRPRAVFALSASASALLGGLGYSIILPVGSTLALYLLAAGRDERNPWTAGSTAMVLGLFAADLAAIGLATRTMPWIEFLHIGMPWAAAWFAGERTRLLRDHLADLRDRALRAERDSERERRLAVIEERARIARDLHDSIGHAVNLIAVRAGAARLRHGRDPGAARRALEAIEGIAREIAGETDQIVATLRDPVLENDEIATPLGLASLQTLVAHHAAAGLDVAVATDGSPRPLSPAVDRAAYRILQEGLTNAARHGTGAASVELAYGESGLQLRVTNPAAHGSLPQETSGHGLIGMRERASLLGGRLDAERVNGSFRIRAELPYGGTT